MKTPLITPLLDSDRLLVSEYLRECQTKPTIGGFFRWLGSKQLDPFARIRAGTVFLDYLRVEGRLWSF